MSVDLEKNRNDITNAWKDVLDGKQKTDWALFGYEGQSNVLKVISCGDGGLIELADELNSGKIMYAFVGVSDTKTNLRKFLLINWQGEGAPTLRKGTCANHIRDISKMLTGAQLTINARTEDDIDSERILEKMSSIGSTIGLKENRFNPDDVQKGSVGTNYSRVIPSKEINSTDRDNFWKKEEEEERNRIEAEREKRKNELIEQEKERRLREEREHSARERKIIESMTTDTDAKPKIVKYSDTMIKSISLGPPTAARSTTQAEEMRQQRNEEAKQLIGSSVDKAKAIFSQNTAASQVSNSKAIKAAPVKPIRNSIAQRISSINNQQLSPEQQQQQSSQQPHAQLEQENVVVHQTEEDEEGEEEEQIVSQPTKSITPEPISNASLIMSSNNNCQSNVQNVNDVPPEATIVSKIVNICEEDDANPYSTIKRSPYTKTGGNNSTESCENDEPSNEQRSQVLAVDKTVERPALGHDDNGHVSPSNDLPSAEEIIYQDILQEDGLRARALYDYQADDESEITFDPGDIITHIDQIDEGWWQGLGPDGTYGLFPANYVELIQ